MIETLKEFNTASQNYSDAYAKYNESSEAHSKYYHEAQAIYKPQIEAEKARCEEAITRENVKSRAIQKKLEDDMWDYINKLDAQGLPYRVAELAKNDARKNVNSIISELSSKYKISHENMMELLKSKTGKNWSFDTTWGSEYVAQYEGYMPHYGIVYRDGEGNRFVIANRGHSDANEAAKRLQVLENDFNWVEEYLNYKVKISTAEHWSEGHESCLDNDSVAEVKDLFIEVIEGFLSEQSLDDEEGKEPNNGEE